MKIVIDIPTEMIEAAKTDLWCGSPTVGDAIKHGTPYAERQHGEWRDLSDGWQEGTYECSNCKEEFILMEGTPEDNEYNFCPHCGADMRQKEGGADNEVQV